MTTTILLTVSRFDYLERVITAIELLECHNEETNLLCIVDGSDELFIRTRNLVNGCKFLERLTVKADVPGEPSRLDINARRARIAAIHNQARGLIKHDTGYVLSVEDDTTFNPDALRKLLNVATNERAFGMAEGVELGRWGVPYVGAWLADDIYEPKVIKSIPNVVPVTVDTERTRIDAGGLYFALIRADLYKLHNFTSENGLGPDINLGIELRQLGFDNFIVWQAGCTHHQTEMGKYITIPSVLESKEVTLTKEKNNKWSVSY